MPSHRAVRPVLHTAILCTCLGFWMSGVSVVSAQSAATTELMIVLNPARPNEPPTDLPADALEIHPINLTTYSPAKNPQGVQGHVSLRVLKDGSIGRIRFETPRPPKPVMAEIEQALRLWRFAPPTRLGKPTESWLHLVYSSAPAPVPGADTPPRSLFAVLPTYPYELWRPWALTGSAAPIVTLPADTAPQTNTGGSIPAGAPPGPGSTSTVGGSARMSVPSTINTLGRAGAGPSTESHAAWFSGHVTLRVDIDELGSVTKAEVVRSTASSFERPAVAAVMKWRFSPAIAQGKPVASQMLVPMSSPGSIETPPPLFFKAAPDDDSAWDEPPRMRYLDVPVYPQDLLVAGISGRATARVELDAAGDITKVELLDATRPEFGLAFVASIERCQHDPARRGGKRVPATLIRTAAFDVGLWNRKPVAGEVPAVLLAVNDIGTPLDESALDAPLRLLAGRPPAFASERPIDGPASATLAFTVSSDGDIQGPRIVRASSPAAGYAAIQAVASWCYAPPRSRGSAVPVSTQVSFSSP